MASPWSSSQTVSDMHSSTTIAVPGWDEEWPSSHLSSPSSSSYKDFPGRQTRRPVPSPCQTGWRQTDWQDAVGRPGTPAATVKVKVCLYIAQYPVHSKRFTLSFPWQTCSFRHQLGFSGKHSSDAANTRNSFIQLSQLGHEWSEWKCPIFETVAKGDSNPGTLDCESGILPLSYRAPQTRTSDMLPRWTDIYRIVQPHPEKIQTFSATRNSIVIVILFLYCACFLNVFKVIYIWTTLPRQSSCLI